MNGEMGPRAKTTQVKKTSLRRTSSSLRLRNGAVPRSTSLRRHEGLGMEYGVVFLRRVLRVKCDGYCGPTGRRYLVLKGMAGDHSKEHIF